MSNVRPYDPSRCPRCGWSLLVPEARGPIPLFCKASSSPPARLELAAGPLPPCPDFILGGGRTKKEKDNG